MKKLVSLMAGAAVLALSAAPALASGPIYRGAATGSFSVPFVGTVSGTFQTGNTLGNIVVGIADAANPGINSNIALFTIDSLGFASNLGTASNTAGATFSLAGNVTLDCAYYTGGTSTNIDFGVIGINAMDNNPDAAFEMVGGNRTLDIESNLAGCNSKNTVTFTKTDLANTGNTGGYDAAQFTNTIPVRMSANFRAGVEGATSNAPAVTVNLNNDGNQASASTYGAWKSPLNIRLTLENPGQALLAGSYSGTVSVAMAASL